MQITKIGRTPGYPKTKRSLVGRGSLAQIKTTHHDRFDIEVDSEDIIADILLDLLPFAVGDVFSTGTTDAPTILTDIDLDRHPSVRIKWSADLSFEEYVGEELPPPGTPPDQLEPEWSWGAETITRAVLYDSRGDFLGSSAGEPFGIDTPFTQPILTIERYEANFDPSTIIDYMNCVNASEFWGANAGEVLLASIEDRKDTHVVFSDQFYRRVKYIFKFAVPFIEEVQQGHDLILIDRGTYYIDTQGNKQHFKAGSSETTGNLDGSGGKLDGPPGQVFLFSRKIYPEAEFNTLDLGPF